MTSPSDLQAELNLRTRRCAATRANDVRELEQLLCGRGAVRAAEIERLRPEWAEPDHRYVRLLASLSDAIISAPGFPGYMRADEAPIEALEQIAARRHAQIRAEAKELIRVKRLIGLRKKVAQLQGGIA